MLNVGSSLVTQMEPIAEGVDLEAKLAQGKDGRGELPRSFWETYSAMANTAGGVILLGVEELKDKSLRYVGIENPEKVVKTLWDGLNNKQTVSVNLLSDRLIKIESIDGKRIIKVAVPRANRRQRPVYVGQNPMSGTFRRNGEGDYKCEDDAVRNMLADQMNDARDAKIHPAFGLSDLSHETLKSYRLRFASFQPDHIWNGLEEIEFLRNIGAYGYDRESQERGVTSAGLLMFGRMDVIHEVFPNFMLDYQERPEAKTQTRWIDRVTLDGSWSGNIYDFYIRVITKIYKDIATPFKIVGDSRVENTPVHEALREALVNTLIHADYNERVSILVVKRPDMFGFRNPGLMRISLSEAIQGGNSDCRNRKLQQMFRFVGLAEQAGSGIPKIYFNWSQQHWRAPDIWEKADPDQTLVRLPLISLIPDSTLRELEGRFDAALKSLSPLQMLAMATACIEGQVTHARLRMMATDHPSDVTAALSGLVRDGMLISSGATRGTVYYLKDDTGRATDDAFLHVGSYPRHGADLFRRTTTALEKDSPATQHSAPDIQHTEAGIQHKEYSLDELRILVSDVNQSRRAKKSKLEAAILLICSKRNLTTKEIADVLCRAEDSIRNHYVIHLVKAGKLLLKYPHNPKHPSQSYRTAM